jgi:hypothetical protein
LEIGDDHDPLDIDFCDPLDESVGTRSVDDVGDSPREKPVDDDLLFNDFFEKNVEKSNNRLSCDDPLFDGARAPLEGSSDTAVETSQGSTPMMVTSDASDTCMVQPGPKLAAVLCSGTCLKASYESNHMYSSQAKDVWDPMTGPSDSPGGPRAGSRPDPQASQDTQNDQAYPLSNTYLHNVTNL